jgi:hypothetical protein
MNPLGNTKLQAYVRRLHSNNASLISLDLEHAAKSAKALQANKSLTAINLKANRIGDKGAAEMEKALQVNTTSQDLYLLEGNRDWRQRCSRVGKKGIADYCRSIHRCKSSI